MTAKNPQIEALNEVGQSVWYDNLSRDVLRSGELKGLIESGVSGLTSNPTIFKKAIADTDNYDADIKELAKQNLSVDQICEELMVSDVAAAADLLRDIYNTTNGGDGHASIEVSPLLAAETDQTVEEALRLWGKLRRPNIMIKVPATSQGIPAIKTLISKGLNVNVTLIFSSAVYEEVINAYLSGLEERMKRGESLADISSVASFFVSRVDSICEQTLDDLIKSGKAKPSDKERFFGRIGIANSKLAYETFEKVFNSDRFKALQSKQARIQRPLWASTGTKNAALSEVLYVEELAGRHTVNTMPPQTLKALLKGAMIEPRLHSGLNEARGLLASLRSCGVPFEQRLVELQDAGVKLFAQSYRELIDSINTKVGKLK